MLISEKYLTVQTKCIREGGPEPVSRHSEFSLASDPVKNHPNIHLINSIKTFNHIFHLHTGLPKLLFVALQPTGVHSAALTVLSPVNNGAESAL